MRKNNVIKNDGHIGAAEVTIRFQGFRGMEKEIYTDINKFYADWTPIEGYWKARPRLGGKAKEMIESFLQRTEKINDKEG